MYYFFDHTYCRLTASFLCFFFICFTPVYLGGFQTGTGNENYKVNDLNVQADVAPADVDEDEDVDWEEGWWEVSLWTVRLGLVLQSCFSAK